MSVNFARDHNKVYAPQRIKAAVERRDNRYSMMTYSPRVRHPVRGWVIRHQGTNYPVVDITERKDDKGADCVLVDASPTVHAFVHKLIPLNQVDWDECDAWNTSKKLYPGQLIECNGLPAIFIECEGEDLFVFDDFNHVRRLSVTAVDYSTLKPSTLNVMARLASLGKLQVIPTFQDGVFLYREAGAYFVKALNSKTQRDYSLPFDDVDWGSMAVNFSTILPGQEVAVAQPVWHTVEEEKKEPIEQGMAHAAALSERRPYFKPKSSRRVVYLSHPVTDKEVAAIWGAFESKWHPGKVGEDSMDMAEGFAPLAEISYRLGHLPGCHVDGEYAEIELSGARPVPRYAGLDSEEKIAPVEVHTGWEITREGALRVHYRDLLKTHKIMVVWCVDGKSVFMNVDIRFQIMLTSKPCTFSQMTLTELMSDNDVWARWSQRRIGRRGYYIAAPSGTGKTTFCSKYNDISGLEVHDFDDYAIFPHSVPSHQWWKIPSLDKIVTERNARLLATCIEGTHDVWVAYPLPLHADIMIQVPLEKHVEQLRARDQEMPEHKHPREEDVDLLRSLCVNQSATWKVESFDEAARLVEAYRFIMSFEA